MVMILFICNPTFKKWMNIKRELAYLFHIFFSHFWSQGFNIMNPNPFAMGGKTNILTISSELQFPPNLIKIKKKESMQNK